MEESGKLKADVYKELSVILGSDLSYDSGKIIGSMCTKPHEFAAEIYSHYLDKNLGDPGLFPGSYELEKRLIKEIGTLFGDPTASGSIVSGGSEANMIACRVAKKIRPEIKNPEIVVSEAAHVSFFKAADFMDITIRKARVDPETYELDMDSYKEQITEKTIMLLGIPGTTGLGLVEPIPEIAKLAEKHKIYFHADAAFGGFVLPFLEKLFPNKFPIWDFRLPHLDSMTADPHKMGMGVVPSGGFLIRQKGLPEKARFEIPYLAGGGFKHLSLLGTRPGASAISFWALMEHLGFNGFLEITKHCWENTLLLRDLIQEVPGLKIAREPVMNVLGIQLQKKCENSICKLDLELRKKGWAMGIFRNWNFARVVIMPHITQDHIYRFVDDIKDTLQSLTL